MQTKIQYITVHYLYIQFFVFMLFYFTDYDQISRLQYVNNFESKPEMNIRVVHLVAT